jgi:HEAT repeat protein
MIMKEALSKTSVSIDVANQSGRGLRTSRALAWFALLALFVSLSGLAESQPTQKEFDQVIAAAASYHAGDSLAPLRRIETWAAQAIAPPKAGSEKQTIPLSQIEAGLIKLLQPTATFEAHRFACKELGIIGSRTALPALAKLLSDDQTAGIACLALTTYPPGKADAALRNALTSARGSARVQIINTLGDRRDANAVKPLARLAADSDPVVAGAAVVSLGKIGNRAAWKSVSSLKKQKVSASELVIIEAELRCAEQLAVAGDRESALGIYQELIAPSAPDHVRRGALTALLPLEKDGGEQRILTIIHGSDPVLKPVAIASVRSLKSQTASSKFASELCTLPPAEQVLMIDSLAARGDATSRSAVVGELASAESAIRFAAIGALGHVGDASTVPVFARSLAASKEIDERRAIESALVTLGGGAGTDGAILAEMKAASAPARTHLMLALARREGPEANPILLQEAANSDLAVAKAAFQSLARTGQANDTPALLARLVQVQDPELRAEAESAASQVLARIDRPARRSALVRDALDRVPVVESRISLLGLLPACGDAGALATLTAASADPDAGVRQAAIKSLSEWPGPEAWDALAAAYQQPENDSCRSAALHGLVRLAGDLNAHPDSKLANRYMQLLAQARGDADLKLILGTLAGAANPDVLQLALPLLSNPGVHAEAEVAVKKIAEAIKAKYPEAAAEAMKQVAGDAGK